MFYNHCDVLSNTKLMNTLESRLESGLHFHRSIALYNMQKERDNKERNTKLKHCEDIKYHKVCDNV